MKEKIIYSIMFLGGLYTTLFGIHTITTIPHDFVNGLVLTMFGLLCTSFGILGLYDEYIY